MGGCCAGPGGFAVWSIPTIPIVRLCQRLWFFREAWRSFQKVAWLVIGRMACPHSGYLPTQGNGLGFSCVFRVLSAVAEFGGSAHVLGRWICLYRVAVYSFSRCLAWVLVALAPKPS